MKWKAYPEYKESGIGWVGGIPKDWKTKKLKLTFSIVNGATPSSSEPEYWDGNIPWATPDDLGSLNCATLSTTQRMISKDGYENCGTTLAPEGSLILSTRAPIGHLAIAGMPLCTNQGCRSLVIRSHDSNRYFYYQLLAAKPELQSLGQGSTFRELSSSKLGDTFLCSPQIPEQDAIAFFLDRQTERIDNLIAKKQRQIELLQEKRSALISHAVTKGLNPNVKMKDSGVKWLGEIPEHWEVTRLGFNSVVKARLGWKGLKAEEYVKEGYVFLSTPNIKETEIDFTNVNYITEERFLESPEIMLKEGDVLIVKDGSTLGITNVVRKLLTSATVNSSIAVIRPNYRMSSLFIYYFFSGKYIQDIIQLLKGGQGVPHLFQDDIKKFYVLLPPINEQTAIGTYLDEQTAIINQLIQNIVNSIELMQEYRSALISAAVTGKIDLRQEVA